MSEGIALPEKLLSVTSWVERLKDSKYVKRALEPIFGPYPEIIKERRRKYLQTLQAFGGKFGFDREVVVVRCPGRVNLMGRHVDHRGGFVNPITFNREIVIVAAPREDFAVRTVNVERNKYSEREFNISEELPPKPIESIEEWREWTTKKFLERKERGIESDWVNYIKTIVYLQNYFWDEHEIRGMDMVVYGDIPPGAGLSSSSALVVATYLAAIALNRINIGRQKFVELCGVGEWYVGTRGGWGDHAAMLYGKQGKISHIGFYPFRISYIDFPKGCRVLICNSFMKASKTAGARSIFNERVSTYEIGMMILLNKHPELRDRVKLLRDINTENLSLERIYSLLKELPERVRREELFKMLPPRLHKRLRQMFLEHEEPEEGYMVRNVVLFGIAECERSRLIPEIFAKGGVEEFGRLMNLSHDGDRVVKWVDSKPMKWKYDVTDQLLSELIEKARKGEARASLHLQPGAYRCSIPEIDLIVDTLQKVKGVLGAQLAGAGLGGCAIALVEEDAVEKALKALKQRYYFTPEKLKKGVIVAMPIEGAGYLRVS